MKKYLNLTEGFNPYNARNYECIPFESFFFNGGEPHIKLDTSIFNEQYCNVQITMKVKSMNDFMMLAVASEALFKCGWLGKVWLFIPYFPGARQDRRMVEGEPLTSKVFTDIINEIEYDEVEIFDPHSDVTPALLENCSIVNNHKLVKLVLEDIAIKNPLIGETFYNIISPDSGANKKSIDLIKYLSSEIECESPLLVEDDTPLFSGEDELIKCDKIRCTSTGKLSGFEVYADNLKGKPCIIVDDICDGGGTFIGLAEELKKKNAGDLYLVVSHGIFSKGFKELKKHFKAIYTTDSWCNNYAMEIPEIEKGSEIVNIIKYDSILS